MNKLTSYLLAFLLCFTLSCSQEESPTMDEPALKRIVIGDYSFEIPQEFELIGVELLDRRFRIGICVSRRPTAPSIGWG